MKRRISLSIFLLIVIILPAFALQRIAVDNNYIQQYRGKVGLWTKVESRGQILFYLKKYGSSYADITALYGKKVPFKGYIFIPYSKEYTAQLAKEGHERRELVSSNDEFIWPLNSVDTISSHFGIRWGELHTGSDMPATKGTPIVAAMDGKVIYSGYTGGHGKTLYLEHRNSFFTRYSHNSVMLVSKGDYVRKGQVIAMVGSTGNSTGNHLHFEIRYNEIPLNPLDFLPQKQHLRKVHLFRQMK